MGPVPRWAAVALSVLIAGCGSEAASIADGPVDSVTVTIAPLPDTSGSSPEVEPSCADLVPQHIGDGISGVLPGSAVLVSGEQTTGYDKTPAATSRNFDVDGVSVAVGRRLQSALSYEAGFGERAQGDVVLFVTTDDPVLRACIADSLTYDALLDEQD